MIFVVIVVNCLDLCDIFKGANVKSISFNISSHTKGVEVLEVKTFDFLTFHSIALSHPGRLRFIISFNEVIFLSAQAVARCSPVWPKCLDVVYHYEAGLYRGQPATICDPPITPGTSTMSLGSMSESPVKTRPVTGKRLVWNS